MKTKVIAVMPHWLTWSSAWCVECEAALIVRYDSNGWFRCRCDCGEYKIEEGELLDVVVLVG